MARSRPYLKLAAFIPAIVLVGAFIGCRSGAFPMFSKPEPMPEPHPLGLNMPNPPPATPQAAAPAPEGKPVFMGGPKSMPIIGPTKGLTPAGTHTPDLDVPMRTPPAPPQAAGPAPNAPKP